MSVTQRSSGESGLNCRWSLLAGFTFTCTWATVAAITANFQATTSICNLISISRGQFGVIGSRKGTSPLRSHGTGVTVSRPPPLAIERSRRVHISRCANRPDLVLCIRLNHSYAWADYRGPLIFTGDLIAYYWPIRYSRISNQPQAPAITAHRVPNRISRNR